MIPNTARTSSLVAALLREAEQILEASGTPRLDAEVLLASVLEQGRAWFYAHPEEPVPDRHRADFFMLIDRRRSGVPVAYLTGRREFWSMELRVNRHTLIPRPETECLVQCALEVTPARGTGITILDLGTGSGAIALAIAAERPGAAVTASDISADALDTARGNAAWLEIGNVEFIVSDCFTQLGGRRFDVIATNPPYVDSGDASFTSGEARYEPRLARDGGPDGLAMIRRIVPAAIHYLRPGGCLLIEHGASQGEAVRALFACAGYRDIGTVRDDAARDRVTRGWWP